MDENKVYVHQIIESEYPDKNTNFNPAICYPEYKYVSEISNSKNVVYEMIRECLYNMGFDREHFGMKEWNPLKEFIKPGDVVLLKPNMVLHENEKSENGIECLITHPSLVRAMVDYIVIALNNHGTIIIGDAPIQTCDFDRLIEEQGYINILDFYKNKDVKIELVDFRNYKTISKNGILLKTNNAKINKATIIDLKTKSEFNSIEKKRFDKLRITNYDHSIMHKHHNNNTNEYSVAKKILDADVIINMPKPKTHRKAGVTISLKNLVGINTNKEWLPHHTAGSFVEGGDEYLAKSFIKRNRTYFIEKRDTYMVSDMKLKAKMYHNIVRVLSILNRICTKDRYSEGSWYGNDTIWRTILDLNKIIFYANKNGTMKDLKQRKMLIVADMIISGEGEGPLLPNPKNVGIIAMGINPICFDEAISSIMGFQPSLIPSINNAKNVKDYSFIDGNETMIISNNSLFNLKSPCDIHYKDSMQFKPSCGWKEYFDNKR